MHEPMLHIASAVVMARPESQQDVAERIASLNGTDVVAVERGRIVVVLEACQQDRIAETLHRIAALGDVLSATLVFEHSEAMGELA
ncbi:MAG TPA: chaperone NapD [Acetobacteraceae bacterium]|jgi:nitrate reductase NapD|nr:chaperone NapD [Acetobacteraceae bacterium]